MSLPSEVEIKSLKEKYTAAGQDHLFTFYDELEPDQKISLYNQLSKLDVDRVNKIFKKSISVSENTLEQQNLEPLPDNVFDSTIDSDEVKVKEWREVGLKNIAQNRVAVILMAGGQGTRLGSTAPKGCYDIHLPSSKSLFQLQAERILRLQKLAQETVSVPDSVFIPWYVMTSGPTRSSTEAFFKDHNYFGLKKENIAIAPDGNGGIYAALRNEKVLDSLKSRNIKYAHAYCVDNCLVRVADPVFIGYCISNNADCGAKCVRKSSPEEPVGVIALRNKKFNVIEYSEIDSAVAAKTKPDGKLLYGAANIANHFYTVDFLDKVESFEDGLEYHIAKKKIKHVDLKTGDTVSPSKPNGMKLELFVFDVFPFTERMAVLEVDRKEEFSPLKNAPGTGADDPDTSRRDIINQHVRFVENAGGKVIKGDADSSFTFEISPLVSYAGEGLDSLKGKTIKTPVTIEKPEDLNKF
nr:6837_t:CDS:2 [Entrophospora candida]